MKPSPAVADPLTKRIRATSALLFAAASLCLLLQADDPLWLDELHTVWAARGTWSQVAERSALGNQSAPYFLAEALIGRAFGFDPHAMRALSALAGAAAITVLFRFVARSTRSIATALALAGSLLFWPTLVFYFLEARPYALVYLGATVLWTNLLEASSFTLRPEEEKDAVRPWIARARALWVVGIAAAVWLHPTALLLVPATALVLLLGSLSPRSRAGYSVKARAADFALVFLICVTRAPFWFSLYERRGAWSAFIRSPSFSDWIVDFQPLAFLAVPALALGVAELIDYLRKKNARATSRPSVAGVGCCLLAFAIPLLIASVGTWTDAARVYHFRYLIGAVAALPLVAATALAAARPAWLRSAGTALVVGTLVWFSGGALTLLHTGRTAPASRNENWAALVERLNDLPQGPIVLDADVIESKRWSDSDNPERREYLGFALRAFPSMHDRTIQSISYDSRDGVALRRETIEEAELAGRVYAVARGGDSAPAKIIRRLRDRLPSGFGQPQAIEGFGRVWLIRYERRDDPL
ncbi:MAG TPA: hypothetical protein VGN57_14225 [Pirellulaceae bacterium]|nr:hypothetical protein [Pirellulaceae bacterium]